MSLSQLAAPLLTLGYLKDLAFTLSHPGEPVFVIDTTVHPSDAAGSRGIPESLHGLTEDKVSQENWAGPAGRRNGAGRQRTFISWLCWVMCPRDHFWPSPYWSCTSAEQSALVWQLSPCMWWHQKCTGFHCRQPARWRCPGVVDMRRCNTLWKSPEFFSSRLAGFVLQLCLGFRGFIWGNFHLCKAGDK